MDCSTSVVCVSLLFLQIEKRAAAKGSSSEARGPHEANIKVSELLSHDKDFALKKAAEALR
jgi:hypothetical protein